MRNRTLQLILIFCLLSTPVLSQDTPLTQLAVKNAAKVADVSTWNNQDIHDIFYRWLSNTDLLWLRPLGHFFRHHLTTGIDTPLPGLDLLYQTVLEHMGDLPPLPAGIQEIEVSPNGRRILFGSDFGQGTERREAVVATTLEGSQWRTGTMIRAMQIISVGLGIVRTGSIFNGLTAPRINRFLRLETGGYQALTCMLWESLVYFTNTLSGLRKPGITSRMLFILLPSRPLMDI